MKIKLPPLSEHEIQTQILHYLGYKGFYTMRLNSGMIPMQSAKGSRLIRMAQAGTPDIFAFGNKGVDNEVKLYFFEVKAEGKSATFLQEQKMIELTEHGAICAVVHSIEEVKKVLKEYETN